MAEQEQAPAIAAAFPNPPPYWEHFTPTNIARLRESQKAISNGDAHHFTDELRYLVPPEPPADGKYRSYGVQHDLNQPDLSLSAAGITQIYTTSPQSTDPTAKLLALSRAIILNFLELTGILSADPEGGAEKIEDLQTLFYNAHDLINQYRPHQARESLITMMEDDLARTKAEIARVAEERVKVTELLKRLGEEGKATNDGQDPKPIEEDWEMVPTDPEAQPTVDAATQARRAHQQSLWNTLESLG